MSVDNIIEVIKAEYNLSISEIAGILVALKSLASNPEFCCKVNRVIVSGIEEPLRIERQEDKTIPDESTEEAVQNEADNSSVQGNSELNQPKKTEKKEAVRSHTYFDNESYRRTAEINAITAERYRKENASQRLEDEKRKALDKNLEKQVDDYCARQEKRKVRRMITLGTTLILGAMYVTGIISDIAGISKQLVKQYNNSKTIGVYDDIGKDKLFNVTPDVITALSREATPIVGTENSKLTDSTLDESIDSVSKKLRLNTHLFASLSRFSNTAEIPIEVGEISSYQEFEKMLKEDSNEFYTSGPAYFAKFSRQVVHGMLRDKYGAEKVVATYEKKGENNQIYEFYIRYFKGSSSSERTPEGKVDMIRNSEGRLQTKEYHTLPYEVYEVLAMIGEFSDYSNTQDGSPAFDINGYATRFTDGDVEKARQELKERMTYGTKALRTIIKSRVKDEKEREF